MPTTPDDRLRFFDDLVRVETRLYNAITERLRAAHGLGGGQYEFLWLIDERERVRVADAAHYFAISVGATSKIVDRLEAAGWVARVPNPDNRRSSLLTLTSTGRRLLRQARVTFDETLGELLGDHDIRAASRLLTRLRAELESTRTGTPAG